MDITCILQGLADENRIRILNLLKNSELRVCDIEAVLSTKQSQASRYLNRLEIVEIAVSKKSLWAYCRLKDKIFENFPSIQ